MSLASYIGCNIEIPETDEDSEDLIHIGNCFSEIYNREAVKKHQFSTPFIYEVSTDWGIEISAGISRETCMESKVKLMRLCEIMENHLSEGDFFELYSCWIGEEDDDRAGEITLQLGGFDVEQLEMPEKTLVRFVK